MLDNLNTHFRKCFDDVLGRRAATNLLRRVQFHYTPKHASWLNMAEIEIGIPVASAWIDGLPVGNCWYPKSMLGGKLETPFSEPLSGNLLARIQI